jgi:hypothetical protein
MTNVWHESVIYFGYEICLPDNISSTEFHQHSTRLYSLNDLLPKPLQICSILNRYSNTDDNCLEHLDQLAIIVLGVSINLNDNRELEDLQSIKEDCCMSYTSILDKTKFSEINEILDKYDIMKPAKFYNGLEWRGSRYYESDEDSDEDSDEESNEDEDEESNEDEDSDGCSRWEDYDEDDEEEESDIETDIEYDEEENEEEDEDQEDEDEDEEEETKNKKKK